MAILVKRTAKNPLPNFRDLGRLGTAGMGGRRDDRGVTSTVGAPSRPVTSTITSAGSGSTAPEAGGSSRLTTGTGLPAPVTSVTKPSTIGTTTKPASITTSTSKPASLTPTVKPAITPTTKPTITTSTSKVTTPKPITSVVKPTTTTTTKPTTSITNTGNPSTKPSVTSGSTKSNNALTNTLLTTAAGGVLGNLLQNKTGKSITDTLGLTGKGGLFSGSGSSTKPAVTPPVTPAKTPVTPTKAPVSDATKVATNQTVEDQIKNDPNANTGNLPPDAVAQEDGNYYNIDSNGFRTTYDKDGNVLGMEMASPDELQAWATLNNTTIDTTKMGDNGVMSGQLYTPQGTLTPKGVTTRGLNAETSPVTPPASIETTDLPSMSDLGGGYFQDGSGNVYDSSGTLVTVGSDGNYNLVGDQSNTDQQVANNTWTDPNTGQVWNLGADGNWTTADNTDYTDYTDNTDYTLASNEEPPPEAKTGGLVTMMKNGGGLHMADGGDVTVIDSVDNGDGTYTQYYSDGTEETFDNPIANVMYNPDGSTSTYMRPTFDTTGYTDNYDGTYTRVMGDGSSETVDYTGAPVDATDTQGNKVTVRSMSGTPVVTARGIQTPGYNPNANPVVTPGSEGDTQGFLNNLQNVLSKGGVQGALLGTLFGQLLGGSGGSSKENLGVDMSKVGAINPRTTDFGIGAPRVVTADQYTNPVDTANDIYAGTDLYYNLNAPGYNPVNPPDETAPAEETAPADATETPVGKANGGLATHYTFGKAIDPAEVMGASAQGMRRGGLAGAGSVPTVRRFGSLPHPDNPEVGMVQGRHDYRQGAAVRGPGTGQSDDIPAMLADGEYVIDAELVSMLGDGSNKAGAERLDKFREEVRKHKRSTPLHKIPPPAKSPLAYMKGIK